MGSRNWLLLAMCAGMVLMFVGCEAAEAVPEPRDLVVVNGTSDADVVAIGITPYSFGQRMSDPPGTFYMYEEDTLEVGEKLSIVLSPYVYRIAVSVRCAHWVDDPYTEDGSEMLTTENDIVVIDFQEVSENPVTITLSNDDNVEFPGYTFEVTGEYVAYDVPNVK